MPEKTGKRRLWSAALKRSILEGPRNAELKNEALRLGRELLRGTKYDEER